VADAPFHTTRMGQTYYQRDVPRMVAALEAIATQLEALNKRLSDDPPQRD